MTSMIASCRGLLLAGSAILALGAAPAWGFGFDEVAERAKRLAREPYAVPVSNLPAELVGMTFADHQQIRLRPEKAYWAGEQTRFKLGFHHQGMHFAMPVRINEVVDGTAREIAYDPSRFDFGSLHIDPGAIERLGYAGFRVLYPINQADKRDEIASFLGASYFRVVGQGQVFGLSARGLALDTALPSGEEFPQFREFWIERPEPHDQHLTIFALLDSPRATGAYHIVLHPGRDTRMDIKARLYLRGPVGRLGLAPLTSMFLFGDNQPSPQLNFRPQIHDSSGLLIHDGNGDWIWRPLQNPRQLSVTPYHLEDPRGFGLLQRSREFSDYEDLDDRYDLRPSAWVEPLGKWGPGSVELVEIPSADETNDNIVAFWRPQVMPVSGQPLDFAYRLHWTRNEAALYPGGSAWVRQTLRSRGEFRQRNLVRQADGSTLLLVDFEGPALQALAPDTPLASQVSVDHNGELLENSLRYHPAIRGWRLTLRLKIKDPQRPVEMYAALVKGDRRLTEIWSYQLHAKE
ncbi:glucan biosynthesis protein G [Azotobacter salinestris]|uniref:glucan biosynthesis protein G n=1 Tax=Azotobacter salinestris TaxID=69964 RepID=UPI0032E023B2